MASIQTQDPLREMIAKERARRNSAPDPIRQQIREMRQQRIQEYAAEIPEERIQGYLSHIKSTTGVGLDPGYMRQWLAEEKYLGYSPTMRRETILGSGHPLEMASSAGAAGRSAVDSIGATAGGLGGGIGLGMLGGSWLGPPGAIAGGIIGGVGAAFAGNRVQDKIEGAVLGDQGKAAWDARLAADAQQRPIATMAGQLVPQLAAARPSPTTLRQAASFIGGSRTPGAIGAIANVGVGAGVGGGVEAAQQLATGEFDPMRLGVQALAGGVLSEPTRLGRAMGMSATPRDPTTPQTPDANQPLVPVQKAAPSPMSMADVMGTPEVAPEVVSSAATEALPAPKKAEDAPLVPRHIANFKTAAEKLGLDVQMIDGPPGSAAQFGRVGDRPTVFMSRASAESDLNPASLLAHEWAHSLPPSEMDKLAASFGEDAIRAAGDEYVKRATLSMPEYATRVANDPALLRSEALSELIGREAPKTGFWSGLTDAGLARQGVDFIRSKATAAGLRGKSLRALKKSLGEAGKAAEAPKPPPVSDLPFSPETTGTLASDAKALTKSVAMAGPHFVRDVAESAISPLPDRLKRTGKIGAVVSNQMRKIIDDSRSLVGRFNRSANKALQAVGAVKGATEGNKTSQELNKPALIAAGEVNGTRVEAYTTAWKKAIVDPEYRKTIGGRRSSKAIAAMDELLRDTGRASEEVGLLIERTVDKIVDGKKTRVTERVPFKANENPDAMRIPSHEMWRLARDMTPAGERGREHVAMIMAAANAKDPEGAAKMTRDLFKAMQERSVAGRDGTKTTSSIGMEHARTLEIMPDMGAVHTPEGVVQYNILQGGFAQNVKSMRDGVARRLALHQNLKEFGDPDKVVVALRKRLAGESAEGPELFDDIVRGLSGVPTSHEQGLFDEKLLRQGSSTRNPLRIGGAMVGVVQKLGLTMSFALNSIEPFTLTRNMVGNRRFFPAMMDLVKDWKGQRRMLSEIGALTMDPVVIESENLAAPTSVADRATEATVKALRLIGSGVDIMTKGANEWAETAAAAAGHRWASDLAEGRARSCDRPNLKRLRFSDEEVESIMSGKLDKNDPIFMRVATRMSTEAVGANPSKADLSALAQSRKFNAVFWWQRYSLMVTDRLAKTANVLFREVMTGDVKRGAAAAKIAADLGVTVVAGSVLGMYLRSLIMGGKDYADSRVKRLADMANGDPAKAAQLMTEIFGLYVGGPFFTALDTLGKDKPEDLIENLSAPVKKSIDLFHFAKGSGRYRGDGPIGRIEKLLKYNVPAIQPIMDGVAMLGITEESRSIRVGRRALNQFLEDNGVPVMEGSPTDFTSRVRKAREALEHNDIAGARKALIEAAGVVEDGRPKGLEAAKDSLRRMKILPRIPRDRRKILVPKFRERIGDRIYREIEAYDKLIDRVAR